MRPDERDELVVVVVLAICLGVVIGMGLIRLIGAEAG